MFCRWINNLKWGTVCIFSSYLLKIAIYIYRYQWVWQLYSLYRLFAFRCDYKIFIFLDSKLYIISALWTASICSILGSVFVVILLLIRTYDIIGFNATWTEYEMKTDITCVCSIYILIDYVLHVCIWRK